MNLGGDVWLHYALIVNNGNEKEELNSKQTMRRGGFFFLYINKNNKLNRH